jgi:hypothetical protein
VGPRAGLDAEKKSSASVGDRTPAVPFVVRHCTDRAAPASLTHNNLQEIRYEAVNRIGVSRDVLWTP